MRETGCHIVLDETKKLPYGDPKTRDLYISLGCCLENLISAANSFSIVSRVDLSDLSKNVVSVDFDHLEKAKRIKDRVVLDAIVERFNARGIFKETKLGASLLDSFKKQSVDGVEVSLITDKNKIRDIAELTAKGLEMAYADPLFRREISSWIRPNFTRKLDGIPGYSLRLNTPMSVLMPFMMNKFNIGKKLGQLNKSSLVSAPVVCVLSSSKESPQDWVSVGRTAEKIMLLFNVHKMKTSVFVAAIEMGGLVDELGDLVETKLKPQFLFCGGFIDTPQGHTRRYPVEDSIVVAK